MPLFMRMTHRSNPVRRAIDERSVLDRVDASAAAEGGQGPQNDEVFEWEGDEEIENPEIIAAKSAGAFYDPEGKEVTLEDAIGDFDMGKTYPFIDEQKPMTSKWANAGSEMFTDMPEAPAEDADYIAMFGDDPDRDPRFMEVMQLIEEIDKQGKKSWAPATEVKDGPPVPKEDIPAVDAEGCLEIMLGLEPDADEKRDALVEMMDKRGGIDFRSETPPDAPPASKEDDPMKLLTVLFTDPDPDPMRDPLMAEMDQKNPMTEEPDFTPIAEKAPEQDEQIIILRDDQIDNYGNVIDPEILANDPNLAVAQSKAAQREQEKASARAKAAAEAVADVPDAVAMTPEMEAQALAEKQAKEEAKVKAMQEEEKARQAKKAAEAAEATARAKAAAKKAEEMRETAQTESKAKPDAVVEAPKAKGVEASAPSGYTPPVVAGMPSLDEVTWESEIGEDYSPLREMLRRGEFRAADDWTRAKLIDIAGSKAKVRGWVYFAEVPRIPYADLKAIDDLWRSGSGGKFGYSRQREIYARQGQDLMKMYEQMDWVTRAQDKPCPGCASLCPTCITYNYRSWKNDEFIYNIDAKEGHLPLTSTLRGTRLLVNLLNHPAVVDNSMGGRR
mmetsp:Transcript_2259/g.3231  ORF Transcript_2259/g.3231 Transcript_2259/m.3231 type:complete len:614 (-) Transcript_2259:446-2287(-)